MKHTDTFEARNSLQNDAEEAFVDRCRRRGWRVFRTGFNEKGAEPGDAEPPSRLHRCPSQIWWRLPYWLRTVPDFAVLMPDGKDGATRTLLFDVNGTKNLKIDELAYRAEHRRYYEYDGAVLMRCVFSFPDRRWYWATAEQALASSLGRPEKVFGDNGRAYVEVSLDPQFWRLGP